MMRLVPFDAINGHLPGMILRIALHGDGMPVGEGADDLDMRRLMIMTMSRAITEHLRVSRFTINGPGHGRSHDRGRIHRSGLGSLGKQFQHINTTTACFGFKLRVAESSGTTSTLQMV